MTESGSRWRGYAGKLRMVYARPEIERHVLARHKEILVVDGKCGLVAAIGSFVLSYHKPAQQEQDRNKSDQQQLFHCRFPFSVGGKKVFPVLWEERGGRETCRVFLTTEDTGDTEVTLGNQHGRCPAKEKGRPDGPPFSLAFKSVKIRVNPWPGIA